MKASLLLILFFLSSFSRSQTVQAVDSLNIEICKALVQNKNLNNEIRVNTITNSYIIPYMKKFGDSITRQKAFELIFFRLHKNCNEFVALFPQPKEADGWTIQYEKPVEKSTREQCNQLTKNSTYHYFENDGNKVEVTLSHNLWTEKFSDNTISKLHFKQKGNCEFELEFIESDNISRKNMSIKGDKYLYKIYDEDSDSYRVYLKNKETYYTFKLFKQ
ncbi:hypothetical protein NYQ10_10405 [Flavobacterium johnsoniae]|uniref:hypothetical protein n=1 Tax=Flavobacterium johnsoniae TaxID=986 RepID=UPI0025B19B1D|nr:hypothetical protein [Flavobacterium johnsoniae]WJS96845.1 hypothetical protein NYQ10_10405 [Flavobacterium johnsoniae]